MLSREQAYNDYLNKYRIKIDNMINEANNNQETYINLNIDTPQPILDELKKEKYDIIAILRTNPYEKEHYEISWGKKEQARGNTDEYTKQDK